MSFWIALQTELIKTKRSAAQWLAILGAGVIPLVYFIYFLLKPGQAAEKLNNNPWVMHFLEGWQAFSGFLLPMFVILICSLVPQIEYKNNAWKQVFASPLTMGQVFFSKYTAIHLMILLLFLCFNLFMILGAYVANWVHPELPFTTSSLPLGNILLLSLRTYIALLAIIAFQYWFSLRFRNFIVPIGLGLGLLVMSLVAMRWEHADKLPYVFPFLSFSEAMKSGGKFSGLQNHEWYSCVYFVVISFLALMDLRWRKERG